MERISTDLCLQTESASCQQDSTLVAKTGTRQSLQQCLLLMLLIL